MKELEGAVSSGNKLEDKYIGSDKEV